MTHVPDDARYETMTYNRCGRSGLMLPGLSLGLWHGFGGVDTFEGARTLVRGAFDLGITHFDLANNYGPPPGSAEETFGEIVRRDFRSYRDGMVVATKAGYPMWTGPYGQWTSRKHMVASLDQSLRRMGLDYVDIFYAHRFDPDTPLEETVGALDTVVRQGKALYVGISSFSAAKTREVMALFRSAGTPCVIHQPSYSLFNRWLEADGLFDAVEETGLGCIVFSPLAQGMLTDKYAEGIPDDSRAGRGAVSMPCDYVTEDGVRCIRGLAAIAAGRGQSMAIWAMRDGRVTSALIGASRVSQLEENLKALENRAFSADELARIDEFATEQNINRWAASSSHR